MTSRSDIRMAVVALAIGQLVASQAALAQTPVAPAVNAPSSAGDPPVIQAPTILIDAKRGAGDEERVVDEPRIIKGSGKVLNIDKSEPIAKGTPVTFQFEEAPVAEVVRTILGDMLKLDYVMHPPLQGTVTLSTRTPVDPDKAVFLLEAALQANGLAMVRDARGTYQVGKPEALRSLVGAVRMAGAPGSMAPGYGVIVVPLQYIGANEMATILKPMVAGDAIVRVDNVRNVLVMQGNRTQAEGWMEMVKTFDVDLLKGMSVGIYPLKYASIEEISTALQMINGGNAGAAGQGGPAGAGAAGGGTSATANQRGAQVRAGAAGAPGSAPQISGNAAAAAAVLSSLGESNPLFGAIRVMPVPRLNAILVITPRASYLEEAEKWIRRLDVPSSGGGEPELHIYRVQNGNAQHLAGVLGGIFGGTGGGATGNMTSGVAPGMSNTNTGFNSGLGQSNFGLSGGLGSTGGLGLGGNRFGTNNNANNRNQPQQQGATVATIGNIRAMADPLNNTILIWSTGTEFRKIEATLRRLDVPPVQVLIEASILEVTLTDSLQYGLKWVFGSANPAGSNSLHGIGNVGNLGPNGDGGSAGFTYSLFNSANQIRAQLNALAKDTEVKMLSSPSLMVLDNHTANISVGDQQPVSTGSTYSTITSGVLTNNIQYKDTGVLLNVTPSVNSGNMVTMQVDQSVIDVGADIDEATKQRPFLQRQISSKVAVRSGEAIVMGGLIRDSKNSGDSGIPLLKDIPVFGKLFSSTSIDKRRTELLVVITPRVVRTDVDIREVSDELRDRLRGLDRDDLPQTRRQAPAKPVTAVQPLRAQ
ncbi:type II secretion system secretin GspD [Comamonas humi]